MRTIPELIAQKRDGKALADDEIRHLIATFTNGDLADYQMTALAMAICIRGMTPAETAALTLAMRDSGRVVELGGEPGRCVDKHSTGGVGDKVSICLAPIVAACGVKVPMVSGRGLGHTGGTLDKLEAIPGFSVSMSVDAFVEQVNRIGCALIGQTADIAPADKRLYALRDVTGTVESVPLITASILSKKLAEGIDGLVLDVKVGDGAFMKSLDDARALAESLVRVGKLAKKKVTAILTPMDSPIGRTIGNALETREALEVLRGHGPSDLAQLTFVLGAEMIRLAGLAKDAEKGRVMMMRAIESGAAADKMREIVDAQGGDPRVVDEPDRLPHAPAVVEVKADRAGFVHSIAARELGLLGLTLGAGRTRADQEIDPSVGIVLRKVRGDRVEPGDTLAELHVRAAGEGTAATEAVASAFALRPKPPKLAPIVIDVIR